MNDLTAVYIDSIQAIGLIVIFGVAAYSVKQMLFKIEEPIVKADIRIEK